MLVLTTKPARILCGNGEASRAGGVCEEAMFVHVSGIVINEL